MILWKTRAEKEVERLEAEFRQERSAVHQRWEERAAALIDLAEKAETLRAQRHHEMFLAMTKKGFVYGLWTMGNGDAPSGQDVDGWRAQVVEAARAIADLAYPKGKP